MVAYRYGCLRYKTILRFDFLECFMICTQNLENSEFSTAYACKYETKRHAKMKQRQRKMTFYLLVSHHQSPHVPEKHSFCIHTTKRVRKIET